VQAAISEILGVETHDVWIYQVIPGAHGGVIVFLDIASPEVVSDTSVDGVIVPRETLKFAALFGTKNNGFVTERGDAATPALLAVLAKYGLDPSKGITNAYYFDQPGATQDIAGAPFPAPSPPPAQPAGGRRLMDECATGLEADSEPLALLLDFPFANYDADTTNRAFARGTVAALRDAGAVVTDASARATATPDGRTAVFVTLVGASVTMPSAALLLFGSIVSHTPSRALYVSRLACALPYLNASSLSLAPAAPPPPPPLAAFAGLSQSQALAFDVPYRDWLASAWAFNPAVQSAVADCLGVDTADVWIMETRPSDITSGTVVTFDIASPATVSDISGENQFPHDTVAFASLFGIGNGFTTNQGDLAGPKLLSALQKYGLGTAAGVTTAYYYDHAIIPNDPPSRGRRMMFQL
jgi:hypothetical protein